MGKGKSLGFRGIGCVYPKGRVAWAFGITTASIRLSWPNKPGAFL
jgi:hypothetical protein